MHWKIIRERKENYKKDHFKVFYFHSAHFLAFNFDNLQVLILNDNELWRMNVHVNENELLYVQYRSHFAYLNG
jgi:hypothetical protein